MTNLIGAVLMYSIFLLGLQFLLTKCLELTTENQLARDIDIAFHDADLVPSIVPRNPANVCLVEFPRRVVFLGTHMDLPEIMKQPVVEWHCEPDTLYTLYVDVVANWVFVDSKAETKSKEAVNIKHEWHQWIVTNIPGNNLSLGNEVYPYTSPPLTHRLDASVTFVYLVYKQPAPIQVEPPKNTTIGYTINELGYLVDFIKKYRLKECIAGNFLKMEWEFRMKKGARNSTRTTLPYQDFRKEW